MRGEFITIGRGYRAGLSDKIPAVQYGDRRKLDVRHTRREFLIAGAAAGAAPLLLPAAAFANWPGDAFAVPDLQKVLGELLAGQTPTEQGVTLKVPDIAENGAQVRVAVQTDLPKVETISLLVEKNPIPLTSQFVMTEGSRPDIAVNLKVRETSKVIALVKADGRFYSATDVVRVTAGGCG